MIQRFLIHPIKPEPLATCYSSLSSNKETLADVYTLIRMNIELH